MVKLKSFLPFFYGLLFVLFIVGCDERSAHSGESVNKIDVDSTKSSLVNVSGKLFSIPSPIQTALLIKKSKAKYQKESLSDPGAVTNYSNKIDRALNLGVYGADMAYSSFYDDPQESLQYFKSIERLAEELEIKGALDPNLLKRLVNNIENPDSLLYLNGAFYESADEYLKKNERTDVAVLILTGTWTESATLTALAASEGNNEAMKRLAEQKSSVETLNEILKSLPETEISRGTIAIKIDSLKMSFDNVEKVYNYVEPETNAQTKTTILKSTSTYKMSDSLFISIKEQLVKLRTEIIE